MKKGVDTMDKWQCKNCGGRFADPTTYWARDPGGVLDAIDWFCPLCSSWEVVFLGSEDEERVYWDGKQDRQ